MGPALSSNLSTVVFYFMNMAYFIKWAILMQFGHANNRIVTVTTVTKDKLHLRDCTKNKK